MRKYIELVGSLLVVLCILSSPSLAADNARVMQEQQAAEIVDTAAFKKDGPYKIGVAAGYMGNSWVVFTLQHIRYEASLHDEITEVLVTDAAFNPTKQVADIEDLISKKVDLILYWPVDDKAIEGALKKAADEGIPTINTGGGFVNSPSVTASVFIDQWNLGEMVARRLFQDMGGKGKIFAMLPIAGTTAAVDQLAALETVMIEYPDIELLSAEYGDWNRAKAKQITENLLQKYPEINGVFSPAGQMSIGVAEAFDEAGRLNEVIMSPGDEYNGWLKWVRANKQGGAVTFPTRAGQEALRLGLRILRGENIRRGQKVPSEYISPSAAGAYAEMDRPDDWWSSELPEAWKPQ